MPATCVTKRGDSDASVAMQQAAALAKGVGSFASNGPNAHVRPARIVGSMKGSAEQQAVAVVGSVAAAKQKAAFAGVSSSVHTTVAKRVKSELDALALDNAIIKEIQAEQAAIARSPLVRTSTIRHGVDYSFKPVTLPEYFTPKQSRRGKKKKHVPPPAPPRLRPKPTPMSAMEVIDLTESDAKTVIDLTGEAGAFLAVTPGRVTKTYDGDVLVEIDGVTMSMNAVFGDGVLGHED